MGAINKILALILVLFFYRNIILAQTLSLQKQFIQYLSGQSSKRWFKCGTLAEADRVAGDKRYLFIKDSMLFKIQTCNNLRKWTDDKKYSWSVEVGDNDSSGPFGNSRLKIGADFAGYRVSSDKKTFFVKLKGWNEEICLFSKN